MKYALKEGIILRHEWFGCLAFQSFSGRYWQFNEDAFEILRLLNTPLTISELRKNLIVKGMMIGDQEIQDFITFYDEQGLIDRRNEASGILIFNESKNNFRTDCLAAPSSVTIYITDYCPKYCRHCATNANSRINRQKELIFDDWVKIIQRLREAGVLMLVISGGEPLSLPYTQRILEIADEMQFGLTLLTDYDNLDEQQASGLKSLKHLISIQTSLDGATAETHDFLRGKGSFLKTLRRLRLLNDAGLAFTVAAAVHKKNIGELDEIAELAGEYGASSIYLNAVTPYGRAKETMQDFLLDDEDLKYMAQTCLRWAAAGKVKMRNPFWKSELHHLGNNEYHPLAGTLSAMSLGIYNFAISSKGDCYLDAKQRAEELLKLGNIMTDDLLEMWNDSRLDKLRSLHSPEDFAYTQQSRVEAALSI
ncbi:MAG: radical SAM protein [Patescibacteria group bacterium]|jgi:MoaA/NifB/PqqE/SkfB family radical SAM enzyme